MTKIPKSCHPVNARTQFELAVLEAEASLRDSIALKLTLVLIAITGHVLHPPYHRRRARVSKRVRGEGQCYHCRARRSRCFTRNGFRRRQLLTHWGELSVDVPPVRCECGGSVEIDFGGLLRPYQRIWDDVDAQIRRGGALAVSLREMRKELGQLHIGPLALRTLNRHLHLLADLAPDDDPPDVPPILQIDAIWITLLRPNGKIRRDRKGRRRAVKGHFKCPVLSSSPWRFGMTLTAVESCSGTWA